MQSFTPLLFSCVPACEACRQDSPFFSGILSRLWPPLPIIAKHKTVASCNCFVLQYHTEEQTKAGDNMEWRTRQANLKDIPRITEIYNQGIEDRVATFETRLRDVPEMEAWLTAREERFLVGVIEDENGMIQGWTSINAFPSPNKS